MPHDPFKPKPARREEKWKTYSPITLDHSAPPGKASQRRKLFALPLELRLDIYDLLIWHHDDLDQPAGDLDIANALLYTCRQIFSEIAPYISKILVRQMQPLHDESKLLDDKMADMPNKTQMGYVNCKYQREIVRVHIETIQKRLVVAEIRVERARKMEYGQSGEY